MLREKGKMHFTAGNRRISTATVLVFLTASVVLMASPIPTAQGQLAALQPTVGPAPQTPTAQQTQTIPDYSTLFTAMIAAIVVAILIGVVNLIALRKRQ